MSTVAVIAHAGKSMGGGLEELRAGARRRQASSDPIWSEVPKSKYAPERVEKALAEGAETIFAWGGDGMVQRCVDVMAGTEATLAILPGGDGEPVRVQPRHPRRHRGGRRGRALQARSGQLDLGKMNGEHFAVMAGAGLDARMIRDADGGPKDRFGRLAYIWAASKNLRIEPFKARIEVNGDLWYKGEATCLLVGNVGALFGGMEAFDSASPEDGLLELGVTHAESLGQWARTVARTAIGSVGESPFVQATKAERIDVEFDRKVLYEIDGGERKEVKRLKVKVKPGALRVRVPGGVDDMSTASHVQETWELTGDDARETLASTGRMTLLKDAVIRLRAADGTSHSRGLAFAVSLVLVQGLVVVVGFAVATGSAGFRQLLLDTIHASAPGPTSDLLTNAVEQATRVGRQHRYLPLTIGLIGTIVTATVAMGQLERAMNRIYGVEKDRPFAQKYKRALALALSAGVVIAAAFALLAFGRGLVDEGAARSAWMVVRWPLGIALVAAGLAVLFNWAPRRRQPGWPWLAFGAWVSVAGWTLVTAALALVFNVSKTFGQTYGSLAGLVALQLWTFFSALAILYGVAVAAQLEAVRAGVPEAQDLSKDEMTVAEPVSV